MNKIYGNIDKKIWRVLICKKIVAKEVDKIMTGNKEIRYVIWDKNRFKLKIFRFKLQI